MTRSEQRKLVERLQACACKMTPQDQKEFAMLAARDKDDEDLDSIARAKLERIHTKYIKPRSKEEIEELWKKLSHAGQPQ